MFAGKPFPCVLHVHHRASGEQLRLGRSPLPGISPAENLPAGVLLRHHRDGHQPEGRSAGEGRIRKLENVTVQLENSVFNNARFL